MQHNNEAQEYDDDSLDQRGRTGMSWFTRIFTRGGDEDEGFEEEGYEESDTPDGAARVPSPGRASGGSAFPFRRAAPLRMDTVRRSHVSVRLTVKSFEDVGRAVDGLRDGVQQIVNFEQTPADMTERLIDFLNGATYALYGAVEKIGEQVYLFTPPNVTIDVEEKPMPTGTKTPFFDQE